MNRKQRRALQNEAGPKGAEQIATTLTQFGNLPQQCVACQKDFDKQDKDMVQSWSVVVRQEAIRLFCPECIKKTQEIIDER